MKENKFKNVIKEHIVNNKKEYISIILIFIAGIIIGVLCVNNIQDKKILEIKDYINDFIKKIKTIEDIKQIELFKNSISQNIKLALTIWFFGTTVIRNTNCFWNNCV